LLIDDTFSDRHDTAWFCAFFHSSRV
jgi:hypothetical protein